jgi:formate-dependent nitrite reductase membrane component NrfD
MISAIIWYLFAGVAFNFLWDLITTRLESEQNRFTMLERFIVVLIWPIALLFFVTMFIKTVLFGDNNDNE